MTRLMPDEVREKLEAGCDCKIVDVRNPYEYETYHIPGSLPIPLPELAERYEGELRPEDEIICVCEHGIRSQQAAQFLQSRGFTNVSDMDGGMAAWPGPVEP
ncbi:MAG TPA: rhodanese-like domain-containing protein [Capsulimonadaceae bacterium]|nr:rhodanese-like domain-containing protein [Capsulimonadaceae bacterium]